MKEKIIQIQEIKVQSDLNKIYLESELEIALKETERLEVEVKQLKSMFSDYVKLAPKLIGPTKMK